jgi:hypothetical protein
VQADALDRGNQVMALMLEDELTALIQSANALLGREAAPGATCRGTSTRDSILMAGQVIANAPPGWMDCSVSEEELWEHVAQATRHRMTGQRLQALHSALRRQELGEQHDQAPGDERSHQGLARARESIAALETLLPLRGRGLVQRDVQQLLNRFPVERMVTVEGATACAAELERMAGRGAGNPRVQGLLRKLATAATAAAASMKTAAQIRSMQKAVQDLSSVAADFQYGLDCLISMDSTWRPAKCSMLAQQALQAEQNMLGGMLLPQQQSQQLDAMGNAEDLQQPETHQQLETQGHQRQPQHQPSTSATDMAEPPGSTSGKGDVAMLNTSVLCCAGPLPTCLIDACSSARLCCFQASKRSCSPCQ